MKYTVIWKPTAEAELARLWLNATDRAAVTAGVKKIENRRAGAADVQKAGRAGSETELHRLDDSC